jgi:hypothetical protein
MGKAAEGWFVEMIEVGVGQEDKVNGGQVFEAQARTFEALEEKKPVGKVGIDEHIEVVNWTRNEAWPIQVMATWPKASLGKAGLFCWPVRRVSRAFQTISRKKVRGLKCLAGVRSLNERGSGWRTGTGRQGLNFVILQPQA